MIRILSGVALAIVLSVSATAAPIEAMGYAKGVCEKFVIAGNSTTKECQGKLVNTAYGDGRTGFYFTFRRGAIITFSGFDRPNPTPDTDLFAIDQIIFSIGGETKSFSATGACRYGNFRKGHRRVICKGTGDDGAPFEAIFRMTTAPEQMPLR